MVCRLLVMFSLLVIIFTMMVMMRKYRMGKDNTQRQKQKM